jgi:hypothetical protein
MKRVRLVVLGVLLAASLGALLFLFWLERLYDDAGQNYAQIEVGLWMGGDVTKPPRGTQAVLNLCEKPDPYRAEVHLWEPIPDRDPAPSLAWLRRMVEFVDAQRRAGLTVYVHCRNGVSRSGMVVTAYEMYKNHWTRDEALAFVRSKRPIARPNPAFMKRLKEWEQERSSSSAAGDH